MNDTDPYIDALNAEAEAAAVYDTAYNEGWNAGVAAGRKIKAADLARLIVERDLARRECEAWREWKRLRNWPEWEGKSREEIDAAGKALRAAREAHDAGCRGWEKQEARR